MSAATTHGPAHVAAPGARLHRARRIYRTLAPWLAVAGALVWFVALRPVALGGPAGYVVVAGTSMEPLYRTGDLVVTRRAESYRTGDVVAFGIPDSGAIVIHRIVGGDAEAGYVLRGDNKPQDDVWRPTPDDVLGKAVVHVPRVGALLRPQSALAALAGVFAFLGVTAPTAAGPARRPRARRASRGWRGRHPGMPRISAHTRGRPGGGGSGREREATVAETDRPATPTRRRRRAVGPPGAAPAQEPALDVTAPPADPPPDDDDERLLREVPPHHA